MTIVTLTTDFGEQDGYIGMMKGVINTINPAALLVDISHQIEPQNVLQGAFVLYNAHYHFPPNSIHVAVVDPGVSTDRRTICLNVPEVGIFIGPDNGLFSYIIDTYPNISVREPLNQAFHRQFVSNTFFGRDIYAPVAAHLSKGEPFEKVGPLLDVGEVVSFEDLWPQWEQVGKKKVLQGRVLHIDHFGNIISNIHRRQFDELTESERRNLRVHVEYYSPTTNRKVRLETNGIKANYGDGSPNELITLFGSSDFLELARVNGYAAFDVGNPTQDQASVRVMYRRPQVEIGTPFVVEI
jgi:S-adenosylmethionine hydrolase